MFMRVMRVYVGYILYYEGVYIYRVYTIRLYVGYIYYKAVCRVFTMRVYVGYIL